MKWEIDPAQPTQIICQRHHLAGIMDPQRECVARLSRIFTLNVGQQRAHEVRLYGGNQHRNVLSR